MTQNTQLELFTITTTEGTLFGAFAFLKQEMFFVSTNLEESTLWGEGVHSPVVLAPGNRNPHKPQEGVRIRGWEVSEGKQEGKGRDLW